MPAAAALLITPDDLAELHRWARSAQLPAVLAQRACILLLAADGVANTQIAQRVGVSRPIAMACRRRYVRGGLDGLPDRPRPGRPQTVRRARRAEILSATLNPPPARLGITHWSTRLLARELGVSHDTIARVWHAHGVQPWRVGTFKFSTHPELAAKVHDVIGLYLHPPDRGRAVRRREIPDPSPRAHPARPPRVAATPRATHPRLHPTRHHHLVRGAGGRDRTGHRPLRTAPPPPGIPGDSSGRLPAPTRAASCTWSATTTPPTSTRRSMPGSPAIPASGCTSPQPQRRG
jgi:transposase